MSPNITHQSLPQQPPTKSSIAGIQELSVTGKPQIPATHSTPPPPPDRSDYVEEYYDEQLPEKKRRLTPEQVDALIMKLHKKEPMPVMKDHEALSMTGSREWIKKGFKLKVNEIVSIKKMSLLALSKTQNKEASNRKRKKAFIDLPNA
ncbi:hypothetical protein QJS10_CPB15g00917 [Acorus calamus]|uniref:Uncharacterized protein n=1 Tax=Acorus calamus TaxID=4465 RepID=A0AAV9DA21_ACOCL|nr:hypothetical protein QJS10_CPB15g00917 [Acorus calamus]